MLDRLVSLGLIDASDVTMFANAYRGRFDALGDLAVLGNAVINSGLVTAYQYHRVRAGTTHGLVLGSYRIRERLGGGSVGVVFLGEHAVLKRKAAIKVVPVDRGFPVAILDRFYDEMRAVAALHHPNIVTAYDAGRLAAPNAQQPDLHYLALEWLPGGDLECYVTEHGPVPIPVACAWGVQAAAGLKAAHDRGLIHRDVKPSNVLLAADNQVKVVDFGLARQAFSNKTTPNALLGSVEFMAPEQSIDPTTVGAQADVYGLGATLFWLLTGHTPQPAESSVARAVHNLQFATPRRLRDFLPNVPPELDAIVDRMLARDLPRRPSSPAIVIPLLSRFAA
ncbi:MAG: serine/threonine-protein kinase [Gemmataceae bacterium]